ncbi:uncharacterized protein LOC134729435 [Pan paniscus]|uniref:uncharacterized protein LOC134729435 n=1 Tax=Pan paniscus TaxID=9597 RepID=UPI00300506FD
MHFRVPLCPIRELGSKVSRPASPRECKGCLSSLPVGQDLKPAEVTLGALCKAGQQLCCPLPHTHDGVENVLCEPVTSGPVDVVVLAYSLDWTSLWEQQDQQEEQEQHQESGPGGPDGYRTGTDPYRNLRVCSTAGHACAERVGRKELTWDYDPNSAGPPLPAPGMWSENVAAGENNTAKHSRGTGNAHPLTGYF